MNIPPSSESSFADSSFAFGRMVFAAMDSSFEMGRITAFTGAIRGGTTKPSSSECVIMSAPMLLVESPQLVV